MNRPIRERRARAWTGSHHDRSEFLSPAGKEDPPDLEAQERPDEPVAAGDSAMAAHSSIELWNRLKQSGDQVAREELILRYVPLVNYVAGRFRFGLPDNVDTADLASNGMFGLLDAIDKFDPERTVKFETYAAFRIRGAIIDELRSFDWVPRSVRQRARDLDLTRQTLLERLGRSPSDHEIASELGVSLDELHGLLRHVSYLNVTALGEFPDYREDKSNRVTHWDTIQDVGAEDPVRVLEVLEAGEILGDAVSALPEREMLVISLYYYEGMTLREVGQVLGVSESRASQIHSKAVAGLRTRLDQGLA
jgi:RNA polymerase sigma factor for flagellar operon FliA